MKLSFHSVGRVAACAFTLAYGVTAVQAQTLTRDNGAPVGDN
jgi:hypothetical protein